MSKSEAEKETKLLDEAKKYLVQRWEPRQGYKPLVMTRGEGLNVWDAKGKRYLDFMSQLYNVHIGMGNRVPIEAAKKQLDE